MCYRAGKYTVCGAARPCIFQPGNFTGWGSEGVKIKHRLGPSPWQERREHFLLQVSFPFHPRVNAVARKTA